MAKVAGETIKLKAVFTDSDGNAASPSTPVTITVKKPDGTKDVDGQTVSEGATGVFTYNYTTSDAGIYHYKFESDDGAIEQDNFEVESDAVE